MAMTDVVFQAGESRGDFRHVPAPQAGLNCTAGIAIVSQRYQFLRKTGVPS